MNEIQKPSDNLGGLLQIWAVPFDKIWVTGRTVAVNPAHAYKFYFTPESMEFKESPKISGSGTRYITEVSAFAPKNSEELLDMINVTQGRRFIVVFQDGNENFLVAGTQTYPLKLSAILDQGKSISDLSGYKITFSGETISRAVFVDNPF